MQFLNFYSDRVISSQKNKSHCLVILFRTKICGDLGHVNFHIELHIFVSWTDELPLLENSERQTP